MWPKIKKLIVLDLELGFLLKKNEYSACVGDEIVKSIEDYIGVDTRYPTRFLKTWSGKYRQIKGNELQISRYKVDLYCIPGICELKLFVFCTTFEKSAKDIASLTDKIIN